MKRLLSAAALIALTSAAPGEAQTPPKGGMPDSAAMFVGKTAREAADIVEKGCNARHFTTTRKADEKIECMTGQLRFLKNGGLTAGRDRSAGVDHIDALVFAVETTPDGAIVFAKATIFTAVPVSALSELKSPYEIKRRAEVRARMARLLIDLGGAPLSLSDAQLPAG